MTETLLGTLRVFLNITHDDALAAYRVGEQEKIIDSICNFTFKVRSTFAAHVLHMVLMFSLVLLVGSKCTSYSTI